MACGLDWLFHIFLVLSVRVVDVRKRTSPPRVLFDAELPFFFHGGLQVTFENR